MSRNQSSTGVLQRKAISASGSLGDFYDIRKDCLLRKYDMTSQANPGKSYEEAHCILIKGDTNESWNLLQSIGIQDDLQLSLLFNLAPTVGIAAFLNQHREINAYTRILYYSYQDNEKYLFEGAGKDVKLDNLILSDPDVTHAISGICFGIDALIILQIPRDADIVGIDSILLNICDRLSTDNVTLYPNEKDILTKLTNVTVYSNMPALTNIKKINEIPQRIALIKKNPHQCRPVTYYLRPLKWLYPQFYRKQTIFHALSVVSKKLEKFILDLRAAENSLERSVQDSELKLLNRCLRKQISEAHQEWFDLKHDYNKEIKRLSDLIIDVRKGYRDVAEIEKAMNGKAQTTLKSHMHELVQNVDNLKTKAHLISDLRQQRFDYYNVVEHDVVKKDNEKDLVRKLIKGQERQRIICSNDQLNKNKPERLNKLTSDLVKERRKNANLRLIYADFSYCSYKLSDMMTLSSNDTNTNKNISNNKSSSLKQKTSSSSKKSHKSASPVRKEQSPPPTVTKAQTFDLPPPPLPLPIDDTINILLLGETGVGKSTFINAFVNYLTFDSFEEAQSNEPTVLITASFMITTGNDFEEHIIKLVDFDNSNNEDFDHPGQSVTQQCRSYVFPLLHSNGRKLRIIDTPGFGDTRGLDQDDLNIEHILQYINNLTHLNAICFLCKPNASQLNIFFRACFTQLFSLLGPNAERNIIFCFTNARSTFYSPGDTAPLLRDMLRSLPANDISFGRENAFCFDNESFRYLVALQNGVLFNELDRDEYKMSWSTSVKESKRLLEYISNKLTVYHMHDGRQSIKHAQLEIVLLIRPMLEAMRNILRNLILYEKKLYDQPIIMSSKPLPHSAARCLLCKSDPIEVSQFWILPDVPHKMQNECLESSCSHDQHIPINYILEYESGDEDSDVEQKENLNDMLSQLCDASVEFAYFLIYVARSTKDDPFWMGLTQMIIDENEHYKNQRKNDFNLQLAKELRKIQVKHEQSMSKLKPNKKNIDLSMIYNLMDIIRQYPMIDDQMIAVKQTQEIIMEQSEYEVQKT